MNPQERISALERLLARVKRNRAAPRAVHSRVETVNVLDVKSEARLAEPDAALLAVGPSTSAPAEAAERAQTRPIPDGAASEPPSGEWAVAAALPGAGETVAEPLELLDDEIVDITAEEIPAEDLPAEARVDAQPQVSQGRADDIDFVDEPEPEQPPSSSRRPKIATSMDEALVGAAERLELEGEREVPLKTPPPESGPQAAAPLPSGIQQPAVPEDLVGPTAAQLGQTLDLEEARGPLLELDIRDKAAPEPRPADELEAPLSSAQMREERPAPVTARKPELEVPVVTQRPLIEAKPASFAAEVRPFTPQTFVELLDEALRLGRD